MNDQPLSGSAVGHVIPGSFFLGTGLFYLVLSVQRLYQAKSIHEFLDRHVPEQNIRLIKRVSLILILMTIIGIFVEGINGEIFAHHFFAQHITLYILFSLAGFVGYAESQNSLPQDSFRAAVACALLAEAFIWHEHALMKKDNYVDERIHVLVAVSSFGAGMSMLISIFDPKRYITPYIASFLFMTWHGLWLWSAALNIASTEHVDTEVAVSCFFLEGAILGAATAIVSMKLYRNPSATTEEECDRATGMVGEHEDPRVITDVLVSYGNFS